MLMKTRHVKSALQAMPIKTDRRDAEGIACLLHLGWFRPVHCKCVSAQGVRAVLGARKAVQQGMIALEMSLRGLLRNFGLKVGAISRGRFEARIRELATAISCSWPPLSLCFGRVPPCDRNWPAWKGGSATRARRPCLLSVDVNAGHRRGRGTDIPLGGG